MTFKVSVETPTATSRGIARLSLVLPAKKTQVRRGVVTLMPPSYGISKGGDG